MQFIKLFQKQRGFALPFVLVLLVLFSVVGLTITGYISNEVQTAKHTKEYLQARYLAEAGVEDALYRLKRSLQNEADLVTTASPTYPNPDTLKAYDWKNSNFPSNLIPNQPANTAWTTVTDDAGAELGKYRWEYTDSADTLNTTYNWKTYSELAMVQHPGPPTGVVTFPDVIYFHRTYIGYGKIALKDGTELIRKVKVGARVSFEPAKAPDAPVYINITEWEDIN